MKSLFDRTSLFGVDLKNRFIRSATRDGYADEKGYATPELENIYENLAKGGVGAIITGHAFVTDVEQSKQPGQMGIYDDSFIDNYKSLTQKVHRHGAKIFLQMSCIGAQTFSDTQGKVIWGPSVVQDIATGSIPKQMTENDIAFLQKSFADAAARAKSAGFDGVQIHAAHGYVIGKFLTPHYNRRTDGYGGTFENRVRMLMETYQAIRTRVGADYPILVKINCDDFMTDGMPFTESKMACQMLAEAGINAIEISGGSLSSPNNLGPIRKDIQDNESYFSQYAVEVAYSVSVPVVLVGGNNTLSKMNDLLNSSNIAYFSICRPLIREHDLIDRWKNDPSYTPLCISCNKCLGLDRTICEFNKKKTGG